MDKKISRWKELEAVLGDDSAYKPVLEDMVFLEERLDYLRTLPFINVNPKNPAHQKATPAAKLYKELLQQYVNVVKLAARLSGASDDTDDSPLRAWLKSRGQ